MTIESCEHNEGRMGRCASCSAEATRYVEHETHARKRRSELECAYQIAVRYNCKEAAAQLWRALNDGS